jgi:hypothetical protein
VNDGDDPLVTVLLFAVEYKELPGETIEYSHGVVGAMVCHV